MRSAGRAIDAGRRAVLVPDWRPAAAALLSVVAVVEAAAGGAIPEDMLAVAFLLCLAATVPVAFVRGHVVTATAAVTAAMLAMPASGLRPPAAAVVCLLVAFYHLGLWRSRRIAVLAVVPLALYAVAQPDGSGGATPAMGRFLLVAAAAAATAGAMMRAREESTRRAASLQAAEGTLLEHAARGERARIARELHDVVAHHVSMIAVQAETARLTTPGLPPEGARNLVAIADNARTALAEMRRLLGVLREDAGTETGRRPQPGLEQLNDLIDQARDSARASTRLIVRGAVVPLDPGIQLTAYRIVQEALTNARRHAPGAGVDVELRYGECDLRVRVRDNGPGPLNGVVAHGSPSSPAGHGLLGMRERAATVGGTLQAGRGISGGFVVEAVLPTTRPDGEGT
jgi:signal transduction histidine kinase